MEKTKFALKCLLVVAIAMVLNWCVVDDVHSYTRLMLHELHSSDDIDTLIVGGSEVFKAYDPKILKRKTGDRFFNAGSASQQMGGSLAMIKEAERTNHLKTVMLDVDFPRNQSNKEGALQTYLLTDYMSMSRNKYDYLLKSQGLKGLENDLIPAIHRNGDPLNLVPEKLSAPYRNWKYDYVTYDSEEYKGEGFVYSNGHADQNVTYEIEENIEPGHIMSDYAMSQLKEITRYCKTHNIKLILVETPYPDATLLKENYQSYIDGVRSFAEKNDLQYWNFNLLKKGYITFGYNDYLDAVHLNGQGAERFSNTVATVYNGFKYDVTKPEDVFYSNYADKIRENVDETVR